MASLTSSSAQQVRMPAHGHTSAYLCIHDIQRHSAFTIHGVFFRVHARMYVEEEVKAAADAKEAIASLPSYLVRVCKNNKPLVWQRTHAWSISVVCCTIQHISHRLTFRFRAALALLH